MYHFRLPTRTEWTLGQDHLVSTFNAQGTFSVIFWCAGFSIAFSRNYFYKHLFFHKYFEAPNPIPTLNLTISQQYKTCNMQR